MKVFEQPIFPCLLKRKIINILLQKMQCHNLVPLPHISLLSFSLLSRLQFEAFVLQNPHSSRIWKPTKIGLIQLSQSPPVRGFIVTSNDLNFYPIYRYPVIPILFLETFRKESHRKGFVFSSIDFLFLLHNEM